MAGSTINDPVAFADAIKSANVLPGDTLMLLDVARLGEYSITISGDVNGNIIIKPYSKAIIQGKIYLQGDYCRWENIEFCYNSFTTRDSADAESLDMPLEVGVTMTSANSELYRCLIHDTSGSGFWIDAKNSVLNECLIWYNGWRTPNNGKYGHAIYTQNNDGIKTIKNCIIFMNYCDGLKLSGTDDVGTLGGYLFENCIFFANGHLSFGDQYNGWIGGFGDPYFDIKFRGCEFYNIPDDNSWGFGIGYVSGIDGLEITNCFFESSLPLYIYPVSFTNYTIKNNLFHSSYNERLYNTIQPILSDPSNTWIECPSSGKRMRVIKCDDTRAHVLVYNYDLSNTVDVDCSVLLSAGDGYRLTNVQDLFNDITTGITGVGGIITIDMVNRTISTPVGDITPTSTFPRFGCFILEKI